MVPEILGGSVEDVWSILGQSYQEIAMSAQESADLPGLVVVVYRELFALACSPPADSTPAALKQVQGLVVGLGDAVGFLDPLAVRGSPGLVADYQLAGIAVLLVKLPVAFLFRTTSARFACPGPH